jgi:hypothetical protein
VGLPASGGLSRENLNNFQVGDGQEIWIATFKREDAQPVCGYSRKTGIRFCEDTVLCSFPLKLVIARLSIDPHGVDEDTARGMI